MPPQPNLAIVGTIQQVISSLLTTSEPGFLRLGYLMCAVFETILIAWLHTWATLGDESLGENRLGFARLLLFIAVGYSMVACYDWPIGAITCVS